MPSIPVPPRLKKSLLITSMATFAGVLVCAQASQGQTDYPLQNNKTSTAHEAIRLSRLKPNASPLGFRGSLARPERELLPALVVMDFD